MGCKNLVSLYGIEKCTKLTTLGRECFRGCIALTGTLSQQKSNFGCLPSSVTSINASPFSHVCYGSADKVFAVCMRGKTMDEILAFTSIRESANQAEVSASEGSIGRVRWYGTDGYIKDVRVGGKSVWQKVKQNTGL